MTTHKLPKRRLDELTTVAMVLAQRRGYLAVTREMIAEHAKVSPALVSHYLGTMKNLRRTMVRKAIDEPVLSVLAQAIAARDTHAMRAPDELRKRALASLAG